MSIDMLVQALIGVFGVSSVFLFSCKHLKLMRIGFITSLISQPLWYYTTFTHGQWGLFFLCNFYTFAACRGIWHHWIKKDVVQ